MIPAKQTPAQPPRWQQLWRDAITDPVELLRLLGVESHASTLLAQRDSAFAMRVPRGFAQRMRRGDPSDPLLLQVLPGGAEIVDVPGFVADAVGDAAARAARGVLHKYAGRALLIATGSCAVHCRYCFRRHFAYADDVAVADGWREALDYLRGDATISEIILSGGDPLSLSTRKLTELGDALLTIAHIRRLRIHTRLPIVLPERVDDEFRAWLAALPLQKVVVLHANHANEFDGAVDGACAALREAGALLLNQSVLLRGINDHADTLCDLSERLLQAGVTPYYLHQLDRVSGAAHFEVADADARRLLESMRQRLPGYLVPRLVREVAGAPNKIPL